ncbi:MAG: carbohydrate kinase [Chitinophagaceae bacterium]|nr:carbohydrate kinase [Chitinophagaceae bacterium]
MNFKFVCFGEVLFDVLPTEVKAGGAPMNVAYHLGQLGNRTTIISKLGNDVRGRELTSILKEKNINLDYLQIDPDHDTSVVLATPNEQGDMKYEIVENVAWDFIELKQNYESLIKNAGYFIFGSLVTRSHVSRSTLFNLLDVPCKRVFDINLRAPFINQKSIEYQLNKTDILKMNEEELDLVSSWYVQFNTIEDKVRFLQNKFQITTLIVTRGAKGAVVNQQHSFYYHDGFKVTVADTIGSGDSFLAGFLSELIKGNAVEEALDFACCLGAFVATKAGGCPDYTIDEIKKLQSILH